MSSPADAPERRARVKIDAALVAAGWVVQNRDDMNLSAGRGVAVREFKLKSGHGFADYLLFVDGKAVGVLEAKPEGFTVLGVEPQAKKYAQGLPANLNPPVAPLPFLYISTGAVTTFTNLLDRKPKSRRLFQVHRPETLADWLAADTLDAWVKALHTEGSGLYTASDDSRPSSLRTRLSTLPPLDAELVERRFLRPNQFEAINHLEHSLKQDKPRALVQMATGSGKTFFAVTAIYRQIKFAGARRVLFLVDRTNLGEQAEKEFQSYRTPDDQRKFTELYNVQRLTSDTIGSSAKVVITTVQRLYSMLKGEPYTEPEEDGASLEGGVVPKEPVPVVYSKEYPPEYFDFIYIDECHRSIYAVWREVLEYFDAYLIGLTATPAKHTFGFFNKNLVMSYPHERAVADGVNVQFFVYKLRSRIGQHGATIEAGDDVHLRVRTRTGERWLKPDEDLSYQGADLDRRFFNPDTIRTLVQGFRDRVRTEIFPGRKNVPKTLVFAKSDQHAEDIVAMIRDEFGEGNDFCQKITYKTTGKKPSDLIAEFRQGFNPRIAVTVDMIATGTDIRPVEIVWFMRSVQSRVLFEQMKGRGVRVIDQTELLAASPDATAKTHFVIVDSVGVTESELADTEPLDRNRHVALKELLEHVAAGGTDPDYLSSLAARLARLERGCSPQERGAIAAAAGGVVLGALVVGLLDAVDPDRQVEKARELFSLGAGEEPQPAQVKAAAAALAKAAVAPLATKPELRKKLLSLRGEREQIVDHVNLDELLAEQSGFSQEAKEHAMATVASFEQFLVDHREEIDALRFFYSVPHGERLRYQDIKALAQAIQAPPRAWTPEVLWRAYELLQKDKVKGAGGKRLLVDIVSLVRFALQKEAELRPYGEVVRERFANWMAQQANGGRRFSAQQVRWLEMMREHIATSVEVEVEDFDAAPFVQEGGLGKASMLFGKELPKVIKELNEALAA